MRHFHLPYFTFIVITLSLAVAGCDRNKDQTEGKEYSISITDSIRVDFLGNLKLKDYHPQSDKYLLSNDGMDPILEVSNTGYIIRNYQTSSEGPNAIPSPGTTGYFGGELFIYDMVKGFLKVNKEGVVTSEINIPYQHTYLVFPPQLPLVKHKGNDFYYITPLTDDDFIDGMGEKFYTNYYQKPLMEKVNIKSGKITPYFDIPEQSIFKDGMNHGIYIPIIKNKGKVWLVSTWFDPHIYLYEEDGENITLMKTIDLQIKGMVRYESIPMNNSKEFFDINSNVRAGNINDILFLDDYTIIVYRKGLDQTEQHSIKETYPENTHIEIERKDQFRAVILDKEYNVLHNDVLFPKGVYYPNIINNSNEIVALRNAELFDVEDDEVILYKMKLSIK